MSPIEYETGGADFTNVDKLCLFFATKDVECWELTKTIPTPHGDFVCSTGPSTIGTTLHLIHSLNGKKTEGNFAFAYNVPNKGTTCEALQMHNFVLHGSSNTCLTFSFDISFFREVPSNCNGCIQPSTILNSGDVHQSSDFNDLLRVTFRDLKGNTGFFCTSTISPTAAPVFTHAPSSALTLAPSSSFTQAPFALSGPSAPGDTGDFQQSSNNASGSGTSGGVVAGIIIGISVFLFLIIMVWERRQQKQHQRNSKSIPTFASSTRTMTPPAKSPAGSFADNSNNFDSHSQTLATT